MENLIQIELKDGKYIEVNKSKIKNFIYKYKGIEYPSNMLEFEQEAYEVGGIVRYFFASQKCPIIYAEIRNNDTLYIEVSDVSTLKH